MDFIFAIIICVVIFLTCSLCGYCCRTRKEGAIFSTPVVVTSTTTTAGGYPVSVEPTPGGGYQATPYPTAMPMPMPMPTSGTGTHPYPTHPGAMPMPMTQTTPYPPPSAGFAPNVAPYPPAGPAASQVNPPSYEQVVASDSYGKQSPYNPNYTTSH